MGRYKTIAYDSKIIKLTERTKTLDLELGGGLGLEILSRGGGARPSRRSCPEKKMDAKGGLKLLRDLACETIQICQNCLKCSK